MSHEIYFIYLYLINIFYIMSHEIQVKINFNKERSFCYYNKKGKRIRVYNGNNFNQNLFPNKEKNLDKRKSLL